MDFNKPIRDWLLLCPAIKKDKIYFQFLKVGNEEQAFITEESNTEITDIIGNISGIYNFAIIDFRSLSTEPMQDSNENFNDFAKVKDINIWIKEQNKVRNYPIIEGIFIDKIEVPQSPNFSGADTTQTIPLAKYMINININYEEI